MRASSCLFNCSTALDVEETHELLAASDEGIRSAETPRTFSLEEVRGEIKKWATKSA